MTNSSRVKVYNYIQLAFSISEFVIGLAFLIFILFDGFTVRLETWLRQYVLGDYLVLVTFVLILGIAEALLLFPLSFISRFIIEHRFRLSDQKLGSWIWERFKSAFLGALFGMSLVIIFYWLLSTFPEYWWFMLGTVMLLFSVILSRLAPVLIFPLFYKFEKINDENLAQRISDLCNRVGMSVVGVYQFNLSKTTKKGNAAFTGLGKSRRVILGDTLIANMTNNEILGVLAHELGHYRLKHLWKSMGLSIVLTYLGLFIVSRLYRNISTSIGFSSPTQIAGLPLIALILTAFEFIVTPLINAYSRANERAADDFAVKLLSSPDDLVSGLEKLANQNLSDRSPNPVVEFFYYSHPPMEKRIRRINKKEH